MKKFFGFLIAAIFAVSCFTTVVANSNCGGDKKKCAGGGDAAACSADKCMEKINLSQEQKDKIKGLKDAFKTNTEATRNEIKELKTKAKALKESGDKEGLQALRGQIESKALVIKSQHEKLESEIKNLLTAEQQTQFAEMMKSKECRKGGEGKACCKGGEDKKACCNKGGESKVKACCKDKKTSNPATIEKNGDAEIK